MQLIDNVGLPEVAEFVGKQLALFDTSKLDSFTLGTLPKRPWTYTSQYPKRVAKRSRKFVHQYRLRASVNLSETFPYCERVVVGTQAANTPAGWEYVYSDVEFANQNELLVFAAGGCSFRFLRHSQQVPGRNGNPGANTFGLSWLEAWRRQHEPITDRRGLVADSRRRKELRRLAALAVTEHEEVA